MNRIALSLEAEIHPPALCDVRDKSGRGQPDDLYGGILDPVIAELGSQERGPFEEDPRVARQDVILRLGRERSELGMQAFGDECVQPGVLGFRDPALGCAEKSIEKAGDDESGEGWRQQRLHRSAFPSSWRP